MTVETLEFRQAYAGDAATTVFAVPFRFIADADLGVYKIDPAVGVYVRQVLAIDYNVTGAQSANGGSVIMATAPASGHLVIIELDPEIKQPTRYRAGTDFPAEDVEDDLDRAVQRDRWLRDAVDRSVKAPRYETADMTLPAYAAGMRFGWDETERKVALFADSNDALGVFTAQALSLPEGADIVPLLQASIDAYQANGAGGARYVLRSSGAGWYIDQPLVIGPGASITIEFLSPVLLGREGRIVFEGRIAEDTTTLSVASSVAAAATTMTIVESMTGRLAVGDYVSIRATAGAGAVGSTLHEARVTDITDQTVTFTPALPFALTSAARVNRRQSTLLTANGTRNALQVAVTSAGDLMAGDMVQIEDDSVCSDVAGSSTARTHIEQARVVAVSGTTITLDSRLSRAYTTAKRARLTKINPAKGSAVVGAQCIHREEAGTERIDVFEFRYAEDCYVVDCAVLGAEAEGSRGQAFRFFRSLRCFAVRPRHLFPQYLGAGESYSVTFLQSTQCEAVAAASLGARHGVVYEAATRCGFDGEIGAHYYAAVDVHGENSVDCWCDVTVDGGTDNDGSTAVSIGHNENLAGDHGFEIRRLHAVGNSSGIEILSPSTKVKGRNIKVVGAAHVLQIQDTASYGSLTVSGVDLEGVEAEGITDYVVNLDGRANGGSDRPIDDIRLANWRWRDCIKGLRLRYAGKVHVTGHSIESFTPNSADYAWCRALDVTGLSVTMNEIDGVGRPFNLNTCPDAGITNNLIRDQTLEPTVEIVDSPRAFVVFNTIAKNTGSNLEVLDENGGSTGFTYAANWHQGFTATEAHSSTGTVDLSIS